MAEAIEPKESTVGTGDTQVVDKALDDYEAGTLGKPEESSPSKDAEGAETEETEDAVEEQPKTSEETEETKEETPEKEEDPQDLLFRKAYNKTKAKFDKELTEIKKSLPSKEETEELRAFRSSPEYIQLKGKADGLTQVAIDKRLRDAGHSVPERPVDDVELVVNKLGMDSKTITEQDRAYISDQTKIARVMFEHMMGNVLPSTLKPIQEQLLTHERERQGSRLNETMQSEIKKEGVLDFDKDIVPELGKWIDEQTANGKSPTQEDVYGLFKELKHNLTVERLQGKKRKAERDSKKGNLRSETNTVPIDKGKVPQRTGNPSKDMDNLLDHFGVQ